MTNRVRVVTSVDPKAGNELDKLRSKFDKLQKQGAKGIVTGAAAGATMRAFDLMGSAIQGVGDQIGLAIQAASDLTEAQSKANVVFGNSARTLDDWSDSAAESFGASKRAALEAAGTYGNLLQAFGVTQPKALEMSTTLVELAADLASFNNTSVDDAIQALRSGLSGETEPLKRYGIAVSDARMRQELMAQGVKDLGATLTPLQKSQAAYTLILKDSALAQGDFARTAEELANTQRTTTAALENTRAELGERALPAALAWEKAQLRLISTASALALGMGEETAAVDEQADAIQTLVGFVAPYASGMVDAEAANVKAAASAKKVTTEVEGMRGAIFGAKEVLDDTRFPASDMNRILDRMGLEAGDADKAIGGLSDTLLNELFGTAINEGNLAQLRATHAELVKQRDAAKEGSREYTILSGKIAENEQSLLELQHQMAKEEGPAALSAFLTTQTRKLGYADGAAINYLNQLRAIYGLTLRFNDVGPIDFGRYAGKLIPGYHAGGRPTPGEPAIVGEKGPELFVPDTAGTIIPNGGSGGGSSYSGGGSPVVIQLQVDGAVLARLMDRRLRYASPRSASLPD